MDNRNWNRLMPSEVNQGSISEKKRTLLEGLLTEGLKDVPIGIRKKTTKVLLENQAAAFKTMTEGLTVGANIAPLETYIYPVLTRALPNLIAYDIASVQPVTSTFAQVRLLKFRHGVARGKVQEGSAALPSFESNVTFSPYYSGPYIDLEPWNARESATPWTLTVHAGTSDDLHNCEYPINSQPVVSGHYAYTFDSVDYSGDFSVTLSATLGTYVTIVTIDTGTTPTYLQVRRTSTSYPMRINFNNTDSVTDVELTNLGVSYVTTTEGFPVSPEFELTLEKVPIEVEVRKLRATATLEALLDLSAHNVAYESDLAEVMAGELRVEMDRTVLADMLNGATTAGYTSTWDAQIPGSWLRPDVDYYRNIIAEIAKASAKIYRRTRRAPGNWIVCSPDMAALLEAAQLLAIGDGNLTNIQGYGLIPLGVISRRWKAYVDPLFPRNKILVGLKGDSIYDSGYVFSPYVPAIPVIQPIRDVMVPEFAFHLGVYLAAGYKMIDPGFYHVITVDNLFAA